MVEQVVSLLPALLALSCSLGAGAGTRHQDAALGIEGIGGIGCFACRCHLPCPGFPVSPGLPLS
jgi:hypothetical protein